MCIRDSLHLLRNILSRHGAVAGLGQNLACPSISHSERLGGLTLGRLGAAPPSSSACAGRLGCNSSAYSPYHAKGMSPPIAATCGATACIAAPWQASTVSTSDVLESSTGIAPHTRAERQATGSDVCVSANCLHCAAAPYALRQQSLSKRGQRTAHDNRTLIKLKRSGQLLAQGTLKLVQEDVVRHNQLLLHGRAELAASMHAQVMVHGVLEVLHPQVVV